MTSYNRNFRKRNDGSPDTCAFIASPEIVTAMALSGDLAFNPLTDELEDAEGTRFCLAPPEGDELPADGFASGDAGYAAPNPDRAPEVKVDPQSERLQLLTPFEKWDGDDMERFPLLLKAKGKCTTDHISPAGPWLRYRGHLDRISDNMFQGAVNAFTGETGHGGNAETGAAGATFAEIARDYRDRGLRWVVVGDDNYGEGSSREHAAMSPRLLGAAAVVVKSFARIHETNLKKQGVLPLTFVDPADYDLVREGDRVSVTALATLAPGSAHTVVFHHADGSEDRAETAHTLNEEQITWFRAGSALNQLRAAGRAT